MIDAGGDILAAGTNRVTEPALWKGSDDNDQRIHRYWALTGEISGSSITADTGERWLFTALNESVGTPCRGQF